MMPKVSVAVPHHGDPDEVVEKVRRVFEKTVKEFQGQDYEAEWVGRSATFKFTSLGFPISAAMNIDDTQVAIDIDLPMAAMMFKGRVEEVMKKNLIEVLGNDG
jgi:hypothetical protein